MGLRRVRAGEVDTPEEVAKAINRVIDVLNKNDEYNAEVDAYNDGLIEKGASNEK